MRKGISELIGFTVMVLVVVSVIGIVMAVGLPILDQARDSGTANEAKQNMAKLDDAIRKVASEGTGSLRTVQLSVSDGTYRIDPDSSSVDYELDLKSNVFPLGIFQKEGNLYTSSGGSASARQNATHIIIENSMIEVVQPKIGSESNFAAINTSTAISTIRMKDDSFTVVPFDTGIIISNYTNTSYGMGYSKAAFEGSNIPVAESVFHVRSNLSGVEYEVTYSLYGSSDFVVVGVRNVSSANETTVILSYRLGATPNNDVIKIGDVNETFVG